MSGKWATAYAELALGYEPLKGLDGKPAALGALDDNVERLLAAHIAAGGSSVNKRYVEDLLSDCAARISNCLSIREKAYEIEVRAVDAAITAKLQRAALSLASNIDSTLAPIQHKLGANAIRTGKSDDGFEFGGDVDTWKKVQSFHTSFYADQEQQLNSLELKASTAGNGSNYVERFNLLKILFDAGITEVYGRCLACSAALKAIYGIDVVVPDMSATGYLNKLALWIQTASDKLDLELANRYIGDVCFSLSGIDDVLKDSELIPRTKYAPAAALGIIDFSLQPSNFDRFKMKSIILRSARVQIKTKTDSATRTRVWSGSLQVPNSDLTIGNEIFPCRVSTDYSETGGETIYGVHNLFPFGDWQLRLPERSITGDLTVSEVENAYLYLQVSYKR